MLKILVGSALRAERGFLNQMLRQLAFARLGPAYAKAYFCCGTSEKRPYLLIERVRELMSGKFARGASLENLFEEVLDCHIERRGIPRGEQRAQFTAPTVEEVLRAVDKAVTNSRRMEAMYE